MRFTQTLVTPVKLALEEEEQNEKDLTLKIKVTEGKLITDFSYFFDGGLAPVLRDLRRDLNRCRKRIKALQEIHAEELRQGRPVGVKFTP